MTDLYQVLPNFDIQPFKHVQQAVERKKWSVSEVVATDVVQLSKQGPIPLKEIVRYRQAVKDALKQELSFTQSSESPTRPDENDCEQPAKKRRLNWDPPPSVHLLDESLDECMGGGFPVAQITEIAGESGVGKTQFVLSLLCSAQLPAPQGLGKDVMYISTESVLVTRRLKEIIAEHPVYQRLSDEAKPNLDRIHFCTVNTFDQQDLVINYQLPVALGRYDIGLVVIDSIAANFRVEYHATTRKSLVDRAAQLQKLGETLKQMAIKHQLAVVVTNQVSDRFDDVRALQSRVRAAETSSYYATASLTQHSTPSQASQAQRTHEVYLNEVLSLDYQQCFFTGWGDDQSKEDDLKTPALGLTWANQISGRVVLKMDRIIVDGTEQRQRSFKVVHASFAPTTITPVRYEIKAQGPVAVPTVQATAPEGISEEEYADILDFNNWSDDEDWSGSLVDARKGRVAEAQIDGTIDISADEFDDDEFP